MDTDYRTYELSSREKIKFIAVGYLSLIHI